MGDWGNEANGYTFAQVRANHVGGGGVMGVHHDLFGP
jgi:hypothetical protein